jgi:hypothetical protein
VGLRRQAPEKSINRASIIKSNPPWTGRAAVILKMEDFAPLEHQEDNNFDRAGNFKKHRTEIYDQDDPMLIVLQDSTPITTPYGTIRHCCKLLPSIFCFHCRTCRDCLKELDCCAGFIIVLPFVTGVLSIVAGLAVGAGVVFRDGYYDYWGWHNAREACLPFAVSSIVLAGIMFYFHPPPIYCCRVQRYPPLRIGVVCGRSCGRFKMGSLSTNAKQIARRRAGKLACRICEAECLPLLVFLPFFSAGLWTVYLFSISKALGYIPMCVFALVSGATTKFSKSRCRRLTRVCCGRTMYEAIVDTNPLSESKESEDDEDVWRLTSGSEEKSSSDESEEDYEEEYDDNDVGSDGSSSDSLSSYESDEEDGVATITVDRKSGGSGSRNVKGANRGMRQRGVLEV